MNKKTILAMSIAGILCASSVNATTKVADARGNAMGNTGIASADYLTAPFYNPALVASFESKDNFAILFPALGVTASDTDDSLTKIDNLQSFTQGFDESSASADDIDQLEVYLDELASSAALMVTADVGFAMAIPSNTVAVNVFARGHTEIIAAVNISDDSDIINRYDDSSIDMFAFGYIEVGVALAKELTILEEKVSFGITPKYQRMKTYAQSISVDDFDIADYAESEVTKNALNFDLGAMWYKNNFRVGLAIKDLLSQEVSVNNISAISTGTGIYKLDTQVSVGGAYITEYFVAAIDADLTKQTRFQGIDDNTQFLRVGLEGDAWGWAQLRAGYEIDLEGTIDNTITAGVGISPFQVVNLDFSGTYTGENKLGVSAGLAFTF